MVLDMDPHLRHSGHKLAHIWNNCFLRASMIFMVACFKQTIWDVQHTAFK